MKRKLANLALALSIALAACGNDPAPTPQQNNPPAATQPATTPPVKVASARVEYLTRAQISERFSGFTLDPGNRFAVVTVKFTNNAPTSVYGSVFTLTDTHGRQYDSSPVIGDKNLQPNPGMTGETESYAAVPDGTTISSVELSVGSDSSLTDDLGVVRANVSR
ncbi:hypothetical protein [Actinomadura sp. 9N215]|uniref:hypothetical protein n=1 Tax=Actinomadura sp. 9N215 TaxID=3375150 RepID=UPI00378DAF7C